MMEIFSLPSRKTVNSVIETFKVETTWYFWLLSFGKVAWFYHLICGTVSRAHISHSRRHRWHKQDEEVIVDYMILLYGHFLTVGGMHRRAFSVQRHAWQVCPWWKFVEGSIAHCNIREHQNQIPCIKYRNNFKLNYLGSEKLKRCLSKRAWTAVSSFLHWLLGISSKEVRSICH